MKRNAISLITAAILASAPAARSQSGLPQWYLDASLPALDTDGDGIPDEWERRTFGDPAAADSGLDRDGDGLTDLEEFAFGSDPRTLSTMGDGWSDLEKRGAGLDAVCRVVPTVSSAQWLAWLGWDAQTWQTLTATNADGFACAYAGFVCNTPPYSDEAGAADFWLETRTDRPAWLTVGDALTTNSFPVRAGTGRVRIRAAYGGPVSLTLDPLPGTLAELPGATNGLWLCEMSVLPARSNTVVFADGQTPPPVPGDPDSVDGLLLLAPPPSGAVHALTSPPPSVALQPLSVTHGVRRLGGDGWYCLCASPGCDWPDHGMVGCDDASATLHGWDASAPLLEKAEAWEIHWSRQPCVETTVTQTVASAAFPFLYGRVAFPFRPCSSFSGLIGAESVSGHAPGSWEEWPCGGIGCPNRGGPTTAVGFGHGHVNTRNLNHPEEPGEDKLYLHCLGVVWDGQPIDLASLCGNPGFDFASLAVWEVNGTRQASPALELGGEPPDLDPDVYRIKLLSASDPGIVWDRLILVVNNRNTKTGYDNWVAHWSATLNRMWLTELPAAYNALGPNNSDPEPSETNCWCTPDEPGKYMHHMAKWQMRSERTVGGHGHQACYTIEGQIILTGVSAGTADYSSPRWHTFRLHIREDVKPFIRAVQLDGNPCKQSFDSLTHALMYNGENLNNYRACRPSVPNNKPLLNPGNTP